MAADNGMTESLATGARLVILPDVFSSGNNAGIRFVFRKQGYSDESLVVVACVWTRTTVPSYVELCGSCRVVAQQGQGRGVAQKSHHQPFHSILRRIIAVLSRLSI